MSFKESRIPEEASLREFIVSAELYVPSTAALGLRKVCLESVADFLSPLLLSPQSHAAKLIARSSVNPSRMSPRRSKVRNVPHEPWYPLSHAL
jgi:hypothetical protein